MGNKPPKFSPFQYDGPLDVVGEHAFTANIAAVRRSEGADREDPVEVQAWLVAEPTNPHDPNAVAVAVPLKAGAHVVGYLPRAIAATVSPIVKSWNDQGFIPTVVVEISEPFKDDRRKTIYSVSINR